MALFWVISIGLKLRSTYVAGLKLWSQLRPTVKMFVYKIHVNPIHTILKYGDYYDFMDR